MDDDDFQTFHVNNEEGQEIIDWATNIAGLIFMITNSPDEVDAQERIDTVISCFDDAIEAMPEALHSAGMYIFTKTIEGMIEEEEAVEQFREELDGL